jgi:hypothetical protein
MAFMKNTQRKIVSARGAIEVEDLLDLRVHELDDHLDERLALAGHAGRRLARGRPEQPEREHAHQHRHEDRVDVPGPETFADLEVRQVVGDVFGAACGCLASHDQSATPNVRFVFCPSARKAPKQYPNEVAT